MFKIIISLICSSLLFCSPPSIVDRSVSFTRNSAPNIPYASGLILEDGTILTAFHAVIGNEKEIRIRTEDKKLEEVEILYMEFLLDLALLKPKNIKLSSPPFSSKAREDLHPGEEIYIFGSPYGLDHSYQTGYISHTNRLGVDPTYPQIPFIQTFGLSDPGTSGSGVFTKNGEFIGIQRSHLGYQTGGNSGLVIPSGFINVFLKKAREKVFP
ncbi:S1C family serine protease [Leptospira idonii]|uniref:Serine protease n=1 Tax=Leptospira idonii TaxID=1193500 RepID=A0A4R9LYJ9_9LEPT|nr:serine protease [Leptospira idonii]TGN19390.1 serine protease [Leptospira idonii]